MLVLRKHIKLSLLKNIIHVLLGVWYFTGQLFDLNYFLHGLGSEILYRLNWERNGLLLLEVVESYVTILGAKDYSIRRIKVLQERHLASGVLLRLCRIKCLPRKFLLFIFTATFSIVAGLYPELFTLHQEGLCRFDYNLSIGQTQCYLLLVLVFK